jgi:D-alanine-D-alanine ligase
MDILIVHDRLSKTPSIDELDTLSQVQQVAAASRQLGHAVRRLSFNLDLNKMEQRLMANRPDLIFNLVETQKGSRLLHVAPALFEALGLEYTGGSAAGMVLTSNKIEAKRIMRMTGIPTPEWIETRREDDLAFLAGVPVIVKPVAEEASVGIDDSSVTGPSTVDALRGLVRSGEREMFVERFIDGREFNLSILPEHGKPCLLPIAEMLFIDYPADKPRITGYEAKWEEQSWAFNHTRRTFEKQPSDEALHARLAEIALRCWEVFGGKGYARVDLRVDPAGQPYVLEVNLNPCITQDSGFVAAAAQAGLSYRDMVERVIKG